MRRPWIDSVSQSDDSLAGVIEQHHIDVRDFMILSLVCDQGYFGVDQLTSALGLSTETVIDCIERMLSAGLVRTCPDDSPLLANSRIQSTSAGQVISQKILDNVG